MKINLKKMNTEDMVKVGAVAMAVMGATAVTAGVITSRNSTKNKVKKLAKKTAKGMDGILNTVQGLMK